MPLPTLTWVLCDGQGNPLAGSHRAQERRLLFGRNLEAEARLRLGLHDQAAIELFAALRNGIPQLRVYMDDDIAFSGHWQPMAGGHVVDEASSVSLVFRDAFSIVRHRLTAATVTYTATDAGLIAKALIDAANTAYGASGIATHSTFIQASKVRDRTYEHKNVGEAIVELTEVLQGFDWYPVYLDPRDNADGATMEFHVAARQGVDQPTAIFEFGEGTRANCRGYSFTVGLPVNRARAIGATVADVVQTSEDFDASSEATFGTYMEAVSASDVSEAVTLADKASDALRPRPLMVTSFSPDPAISPLPWRDFWIGDTVRWNVDDGAVQETEQPRVQSIEIGLDDSDNISDLVVGIDPQGAGSYLAPSNSARRYVQMQQDLRRRLSALER